MRNKTISQIAIEYVIKNEELYGKIGYGYCADLDEIYCTWLKQYPNKAKPHPTKMWNRVLNALSNDKNNWEQKYFRANRGNARYFILKKYKKESI